jgi:hypothetical protein
MKHFLLPILLLCALRAVGQRDTLPTEKVQRALEYILATIRYAEGQVPGVSPLEGDRRVIRGGARYAHFTERARQRLLELLSDTTWTQAEKESYLPRCMAGIRDTASKHNGPFRDAKKKAKRLGLPFSEVWDSVLAKRREDCLSHLPLQTALEFAIRLSGYLRTDDRFVAPLLRLKERGIDPYGTNTHALALHGVEPYHQRTVQWRGYRDSLTESDLIYWHTKRLREVCSEAAIRELIKWAHTDAIDLASYPHKDPVDGTYAYAPTFNFYYGVSCLAEAHRNGAMLAEMKEIYKYYYYMLDARHGYSEKLVSREEKLAEILADPDYHEYRRLMLALVDKYYANFTMDDINCENIYKSPLRGE